MLRGDRVWVTRSGTPERDASARNAFSVSCRKRNVERPRAQYVASTIQMRSHQELTCSAARPLGDVALDHNEAKPLFPGLFVGATWRRHQRPWGTRGVLLSECIGSCVDRSRSWPRADIARPARNVSMPSTFPRAGTSNWIYARPCRSRSRLSGSTR